MLTESEREWLGHRDAMQFLTGTYIADFAEFPLWNNGKDWQDAAEFSERVAAKLADPYFPPMDKGSTLEFGHFLMPPMDRLMCARITVEEEMDADLDK